MIEPGLPEPYFNLGKMHENALGVEKDFTGAY
jgi:TPR repeat protein